MTTTFRQWIHARPMTADTIDLAQFAIRTLPVPVLQEGEALVRVKLINLHSATRTRMARGTVPVGETDSSNYACAEVLASRDPAFAVGDVVACQAGWQELQVIRSADGNLSGYPSPSDGVKALNRTNSQWCYVFRKDLAKRWPPEVLMEMFHSSGMTAYFGLRQCGPIGPGSQVAVAAASGSVGAIAAQLAKIAGARVIGFAGGIDRCRWVTQTLGIDGCIDYRAADFEAQLDAAFPEGVDVFSDGVGGAMTRMLVTRMKHGGRILSYGSAGAFYADRLATPSGEKFSLRHAFGLTDEVEELLRQREVRAEAWLVSDFYAERLEAEDALSELLEAGRIQPIHHVVEGFERLPGAIVDLYREPHAGKVQVRFAN
jgi:NADPH-dependent curcumin reductase CurA